MLSSVVNVNNKRSFINEEIAAVEKKPKTEPLNPEVKKRDRRFMGVLLGTLNQFKSEYGKSSSKNDMATRSDIERKNAEQLAQEKKETLELIEKERQEHAKRIMLKKRQDKISQFKKAYKILEDNHKDVGHFLKTESKPSLYFMPAVITDVYKSLADAAFDKNKEDLLNSKKELYLKIVGEEFDEEKFNEEENSKSKELNGVSSEEISKVEENSESKEIIEQGEIVEKEKEANDATALSDQINGNEPEQPIKESKEVEENTECTIDNNEDKNNEIEMKENIENKETEVRNESLEVQAEEQIVVKDIENTEGKATEESVQEEIKDTTEVETKLPHVDSGIVSQDITTTESVQA